jgi:photosynthetic reaction center cytochrome c subunit
MKQFRKETKAVCVAAGCAVLLIGWAIRGGAQEHGTGNQAPPSTAGKTAVQVYKNIKVLKDIPADQLIPTMQFISGSLGVDCEFCHVSHQMEKDDKKEKETARKMIAMQLTIDQENFDGDQDVTCYTCHRGSPHPVATPVLSADAKPPMHEHSMMESGNTSLPPANQILDKYLAAVGGAEALKKVKTRVQKGNLEAFGTVTPITVYSEGPDKRMSVSASANGQSVTAFNGQEGWLTTPGGVHRMSAAEGEAARIDASLYFPATLRETYSEFKVHSGEDINGHSTIQVLATGKGKIPLRLYFDEQSGLLLRQIRFAETALGRLPTQIDYTDYRDADGVKIPYQWTLMRPGGSFTIKISDVKQNVPVDEKLFVAPAPAAH